MSEKQKVDTPRKNAWYTQVNKPNFIPQKENFFVRVPMSKQP